MKRLLLILTSIFALVTTSWADQITREQAFAKAQQFLNQKGISRSLKAAETQMSRARARGKSTPDYYYVFNAGQNQGFVIISGEDATEEVLGYSTSGSFDLNNIPPAMEALLNYYSAQISMIQQGKAQAAPRRATHSAVSPFMTVKWNQREPYNLKTMTGYYSNTGGTFQCVTGCVATAMAQVVYHQHFVDKIQSEIPGYQNHTIYKDGTGYMNAIPAGTALDWANMLDTYTGGETDAQKEAVANLMMYCGVAVKMEYTKDASSASNSSIPDALKKYFGYSRGTRYVSRSNYSDDDWDNLIYNEIASGRPVIYGGQTKSNSGHAFIVHGYDGAGKYAINWGWGGNQDNYFTLDNLTPDAQGTGGGKTGEGYNFDQEAVIYLAKEDGTFSETVKATAVGVNVDGCSVNSSGSLVMPSKTEYSVDKNSWGGASFALAYMYTSNLANTYTMDCGYGILDTNGQLKGDVKLLKTAELKSGYIITSGSGTTNFGADLGVGTYYIKPYSKESTASEWLLCEDADKYAILMNVTDTKMSFKVVDLTSNPDPDPEVSDTQRDELKKKFESLKDKITGKHDKVTANATEIKNLQSASASASEAVSGLDDKLAALKTLIDGSKLLTEDQKTYFTNKLADLKTKNKQLKEALDKIIAKLETIKAANDNLKQQLDNALKIVNEQIAGVSNITTTTALDEANAKVTELSGQIDGYDADKVETDIKTAKADLTSIDVNTLSEEFNALDPDIAKAIADAEAAAEAEEAAKKLAEAKEKCNKAVEDLTKVIDDQTKKYNAIVASLEELNKKLKEIDDYIKDFQAKAKAISDMIAEMKSPSADRTRATADEIKKYEDALANLNAQIDKLSDAKAKVEQKIKDIEGLKDKTQKIIDDATKLRNQVKDGYADATSTEAVETMITQVTTETTSLNSDGAESINAVIADINTQIAAVEAEIAAINTDVADVNKQTEDLNKEVTSGIGNISIDENDILGRYDLSGRPVDANYKGAMIIRMTNGKTITIFKR